MPYDSKTTQESNKELITKLEDWFRSAMDHPSRREWEELAINCNRYKENDQWSASEKLELEKRGQPATVENQVKVTIDRMVGQFVKQRTRIGYRGRNPDKSNDQEVAQALSDLYLYIKQNNDLEFEEREVAEDGFTSGFGVFETYVSFDELYNPEIKVRHVDPFEIFQDPNSRRYDWNEDASFVDRVKWVHLDDAKELYPQYAAELTYRVNNAIPPLTSGVDQFKGDSYVDPVLRRVRIIECWYKKKERKCIYLFPNGETVNQDDLTKRELAAIKKSSSYRQIEKVAHKMYCATFTEGLLLEHKEVDRRYFPFVPYFVERKKNGCPYSNIFITLPIQDAINKRESKAIHLLTNNQAIYERGAIKDKNEFAIEKARPDGQMELEPGFLSQQKFMLRDNIELAATQFQMHADAKVAFRQVSGINPEALGERSEVRSGIGIARKVAMTDVIVAPVFDNFRRTRSLLARNILELVQKNLTQKTIFTITDDLGAAKTVALNDGQLDIKQGLYDVVVDDLPDTTTVHQEQFQTLATVLPQILPFGPYWTTKLIQMSDLRNKDEIINDLAQNSKPPPVEPKLAISLNWENLIPEEKAAFAMKAGMPELAQIEIQVAAPPAHVMKAQADLAKEQAKTQVAQVKGQSEQFRAQADMVKAQQSIVHDRERHQLDMEKGRLDLLKTAVAASKPKGNGTNNGE